MRYQVGLRHEKVRELLLARALFGAAPHLEHGEDEGAGDEEAADSEAAMWKALEELPDGDEAFLDDPYGIAVSWEEKFGRKAGSPAATTDPAPGGRSRLLAPATRRRLRPTRARRRRRGATSRDERASRLGRPRPPPSALPNGLAQAANVRFRRIGADVLLTNDTGDWEFLTADEFNAFVAGCLPAGSPKLASLQQKGMLANARSEDEEIALVGRRKGFVTCGPYLHILITTLRCNQACVYCLTRAARGWAPPATT